MSKKEKIIILISVLLFILVILSGIYFTLWDKKKPEKIEEDKKSVDISQEGLKDLEEKKYTPEAPKNVVETVPVVKAPAAPNNQIQSLNFYDVSISSEGFFPNTITTKKGDIVKLRITATDGTYDIVIPYMELSTDIKKGETRQISFQADREGTFAFECENKCPVEKKISGLFIVLP